jgi:hypothetical protein
MQLFTVYCTSNQATYLMQLFTVYPVLRTVPTSEYPQRRVE